jgi:hypothetical protein
MEDRLERATPLPFEIELVDGQSIKTVGDYEAYLRSLNDHDRASSRVPAPGQLKADRSGAPVALIP